MTLQAADGPTLSQMLGNALGGTVQVEGAPPAPVTLDLQGVSGRTALDAVAGALHGSWRPVYAVTASALPAAVSDELTLRARYGKQAAAVITVDLYGQCADYGRLGPVCEKHGVPIVEDAAEALGARYRNAAAGAFGECAAFSFNGNKIITTSGGGMLVSHRRDVVERARHLATQAREPAPHYQHNDVGFNYRLSNLLAAVGRAQLQALPSKLARRREINTVYRRALAVPGIAFMPEAPYGAGNCWLTCVLVSPEEFGATREDVRLELEARDIESRPLWKPMHLQPAFSGCAIRGGAVSEHVFEVGLCLPSGSSLTPSEQSHVIDMFHAASRAAGASVRGATHG